MLSRIQKLREELEKIGLSSFFVSSEINRRYLSDFSGSRGEILITKNHVYLFTDARYLERVQKEFSNEFRIINVSDNYFLDFRKILKKHRISKLGIEACDITLERYIMMRKNLGKIKFLKTFHLIKKIRAIKEEVEIRKIKKAIKISDEVFLDIKEYIRKNFRKKISEKNIAQNIENLIKNKGGSGLSFASIVASGPNSAIPHHKTGPRIIKRGDIILMDFGAEFCEYKADMTRTIFLGTPNKRQAKIYESVLAVQTEMIRKVCSGMEIRVLEEKAKDMVGELGYAGKFNHSLSHGVGLEEHEFPRYARNKKEVLRENMVFTIEPGIYFPKYCGVRIEDIVCLGKNGVEVLTKSPKNLEDMILRNF